MKWMIYVFVGGGLGSVLRYGLSLLIPSSSFPYATIAANIASSLILGILVGWAESTGTLQEEARLMWVVGFCGGFSTFSTFSLENQQLWQSQEYVTLGLNIMVSVFVCLLCIFAGLKIAHSL